MTVSITTLIAFSATVATTLAGQIGMNVTTGRPSCFVTTPSSGGVKSDQPIADTGNAFMAGGNSFGTAVNFGSIDGFAINLITNNTTRGSFGATGIMQLTGAGGSNYTTTAGALTLGPAGALTITAGANSSWTITGNCTINASGSTMQIQGSTCIVTSAGTTAIRATTTITVGDVATGLTLGNGVYTVTVSGPMTQSGGQFSLTGSGAGNVITTSGSLRVDAAGTLSLGTLSGAITFGASGVTTTCAGTHQFTASTATISMSAGYGAAFCAQFLNTSNNSGVNGILIRGGQQAFTATSDLIQFQRGGDNTVIGTVQQNAAGTVAYNTSSDRRLKENIALDTTDALARVMKLRPSSFNFKGDKGKIHGFIAQEVLQVYPDAVTLGGPDPRTKPYGVDYGRLTPLLAGAVQELAARVEHLERKMAA